MEITLALDWTPNTYHTGFYVAQEQGIYERLGLQVHLLSPGHDEDSMSPPMRVARGQATVGICPSEALIAYHIAPGGPRLAALATLLQRNTSAIVTRKASGYTCPAQLDGRTYATLGTPLECDILSHMIRHDGGRGDFNTLSPAMLDVPQALFSGQADAAWIFMGWEGLLAEWQDMELNVFRPEDYGVPYGYAQVLVAHPDTLRQHADPMCAFVQGSALGFEYAAHNPADAARILIETAQHPGLADHEFVLASQQRVSKDYLTREGRWGVMTSAHWAAYWNWICEQHLFKNSLGDDVSRKSTDISRMFTNQFLL
jgi:NitT/TauT family transport system substrate-binding protein